MEMTNLLSKILKPVMMALFVVISVRCFSQSYHTSSAKAIKFFEKAVAEFTAENYAEAILNADKALQNDRDFIDAHLLKAESYLELNEDYMAVKSYENVFEIDSMAFPKSAISLSKLYSKQFQFEKSIKLLNWYLALDNQNENLRKLAERQLHLMNFRKSLFENPVDYNPKNIGHLVNTEADEYVNQYYVNENKIVFTKRYQVDSPNGYVLKENVFVSTLFDSIGSKPRLLFEELADMGAANISANGNEIYFSGSSWEKGLGSCDIYYVRFVNGKWSEPINIRSINTSSWESQPCISYDGDELFFVRRDKRTATSDIYVSMRDENGDWLSAKPLARNINTEGNEMAPFIHYDGKTLYFSSDSHPGMGGYDLFMSLRDENGEWSKPVNLGYPLNTCDDEINLVISNDAAKAFVSASKNGNDGHYDIYEFDLDEKFRPEIIELENISDVEYYAEALEKHESVVLRNIYFEFDSADLTPDSEEGVDVIYDYLTSNPDKNILLEGHTDDVGSEEYNLSLSERRAESVKNALLNRGVSSGRIKTKGCGSSQPLFPNNFDDELKKLNRRVSMSLID